jgi:[ribosomal protein S5]-alanine N-acetyltransferase
MLRFDPFPTLRTARLVLRRISHADVDVIFRLQSDPEVVKYFGRAPFGSRDEAEKRVRDELASIERGEAIRWGLERGGALVGTAGFWRWNQPHHLAEIGYDLVPEAWGQGFMPEALRPILRYGFETMRLHRVEANLDPANVASVRVLEKLGFVREGVLRENWFYDGKYTDTWSYGLLARELRQG